MVAISDAEPGAGRICAPRCVGRTRNQTVMRQMKQTKHARQFEYEEIRYSEEQASLWSHLRFELRSLIGRYLLERGPPNLAGDRLLNLGCGSEMLDGWVNADLFRLGFWRQPPSFWALDLRYRLKCPSDYWDGVFCEHAVEHLRLGEAELLFDEVFRTLRQGSWFRVSVPDLARYVRYYQGESDGEEFRRWSLRGAALRSLSQGWGHLSLWDAELLGELLKRTGFVQVKVVEYREGTDPRLLRDRPDRKWESLYVEARKPQEATSVVKGV